MKDNYNPLFLRGETFFAQRKTVNRDEKVE